MITEKQLKEWRYYLTLKDAGEMVRRVAPLAIPKLLDEVESLQYQLKAAIARVAELERPASATLTRKAGKPDALKDE